jgi:hypothetical protein
MMRVSPVASPNIVAVEPTTVDVYAASTAAGAESHSNDSAAETTAVRKGNRIPTKAPICHQGR